MDVKLSYNMLHDKDGPPRYLNKAGIKEQEVYTIDIVWKDGGEERKDDYTTHTVLCCIRIQLLQYTLKYVCNMKM